jgi:hypothetical protein
MVTMISNYWKFNWKHIVTPSCPYILLLRKNSYIIYLHCESNETFKENKNESNKRTSPNRGIKKR